MNQPSAKIMEKEKIHIVACFDKGYLMPTGVMMYSACANNPDVNIDFHIVVDDSLTDNDKKDLKETISGFEGKKAIFHTVDRSLYSKLPLNHYKWITRATYYRLFLPEILPSSVNKVLYLDGDCIVRHSLLSLWHTDISEYAIAAAIDAFEGDINKYNYLHYSPTLGYFNAGVLFINLDYWRNHHILDSLTEYMSKYPERLHMEDQDALNAILKDQKMHLHPKYNFQTEMLRSAPRFYYWKYEDEIKEAIANPAIIHFTTTEKPWYIYIRYPHAYQSSFIKYQNQTKWKGVRIEKRQLNIRIKNYVGDFLRLIKILPPLKSLRIQLPPID